MAEDLNKLVNKIKIQNGQIICLEARVSSLYEMLRESHTNLNRQMTPLELDKESEKSSLEPERKTIPSSTVSKYVPPGVYC